MRNPYLFLFTEGSFSTGVKSLHEEWRIFYVKKWPTVIIIRGSLFFLTLEKTFVISRHDIDDTVVKNLKSIAKNENWILNKGSNDIDDNGKCLLWRTSRTKKNPFIVNLYILFQISFKLVFALNLIALMKSMFKI